MSTYSPIGLTGGIASGKSTVAQLKVQLIAEAATGQSWYDTK